MIAPPLAPSPGGAGQTYTYTEEMSFLRLQVIVPSVDANGNTVAVQPDAASPDGLADKLASGKLQNTIVFKNREPKWNKESQMYQLDFQGRATLASCKNIQLAPKVGAENDVRFLMGKVSSPFLMIEFVNTSAFFLLHSSGT